MQTSLRNIIGLNDAVIPVHYHPVVLLEHFQQQGLELNELLINGGIRQDLLEQDNAKLSYLQLNYLLQQGQILLNNPALGLHYGAMLPPSSNGLIGMSVFASENISQAITIALRYKKSTSPITTLSLHHAGRFSYIQCSPAMDESEFSKIYIETCFSSLYCFFKKMVPEADKNISFEFKFSAPDYHHEYVKTLNNNIKFNSVKNRIIFDSSVLNIKLPYPNKQVVHEAIQLMDIVQASEDNKMGIIPLVKILLQEVEPSIASLEYLADRLCISVSSLKRKLSLHHTNFQKLLDTIRMEKSCEMLEQGLHPIAEISETLGFSEKSTFRKSFKRWTGETPHAYRDNVFSWIDPINIQA